MPTTPTREKMLAALILRILDEMELGALPDTLATEARAVAGYCMAPNADRAPRVSAAGREKRESYPPKWDRFLRALSASPVPVDRLELRRAFTVLSGITNTGNCSSAFKLCMARAVSTGLVDVASRDGRELITSRTA